MEDILKIPIYKPYLPQKILHYAHRALDNMEIANNGPYLFNVTEEIQKICNVNHVVLVNNGTSATHLLIKILKKFYPGIRKIIVPNNSYVAVYNSILYDRYFEIIPVDADIDTWNMDLASISSIPDDTAIFVVHNLGNIINVPAIHRRFPQAIIIEDNCEGFMGKYEKQYSGTDCVASSVSFFINELITCSEGGAVFTNNEHVAKYSHLIKSQGQSSKKFVHEEIGNNFRMTNLQAALLLGQLQYLSEIIEQKKIVFDYYRKNLENQEKIVLQKNEDGTENANWMFAVRFVDNENYERASKFFDFCGIETRPMFYSIREHKHLNFINTDDNVAKRLSDEIVVLPSYPELTRSELDYIIEKVMKYREKI